MTPLDHDEIANCQCSRAQLEALNACLLDIALDAPTRRVLTLIDAGLSIEEAERIAAEPELRLVVDNEKEEAA